MMTEKITREEARERFHDVLTEAYGEIDICGYTYSAADALRRLDPVAYQCWFLDFCDQVDDLEVMD